MKLKQTLLATIFTTATAFATAQTITFATEASYPPFESTNAKGEIIGFDIDIANAICDVIDAKCSFKNESFDALIPGLITGRGGFDAAIAAIGITPARAKKVAFTEPYFLNTSSFIALDSTNMADIKTVGVQNGTTLQKYLLDSHKYNVVPYASIQNAILDIKNKRVDAVFGDTLVLQDTLKTEKGLHLVGEPVHDEKYFGIGDGIAVRKSNKKLIAELNRGIAQIKADGTYQKIYDKWFSK